MMLLICIVGNVGFSSLTNTKELKSTHVSASDFSHSFKNVALLTPQTLWNLNTKYLVWPLHLQSKRCP